jgi:hypothetical protein
MKTKQKQRQEDAAGRGVSILAVELAFVSSASTVAKELRLQYRHNSLSLQPNRVHL